MMQVIDIQRVYFRQTPTKVKPVRGLLLFRAHERVRPSRPVKRGSFQGDRIPPVPCRGFSSSPVMSRLGYLRGVIASFLRGFSRGWKHLPMVFFVVAATGLGGRIFWAALDLAGGVR